MKRFNKQQIIQTADFLNNIASGWLIAGVIAPFFIEKQFSPSSFLKVIFSFIFSIIIFIFSLIILKKK
jgi:hypothetical protein